MGKTKGVEGWGSQRWKGVTSVVRCHFCDNRGPSYILKYNCKYKYKYKYKYKHCNDWQNWNAKYHSGRVLLLWQSCLATYCTSCILKRKKTVQTKYRYKIWIQIQKRNGPSLHFNTEWQKLKHKTRSWRGVISVTMPSSQTTERPTLHASPEIRPLIAAASAAKKPEIKFRLIFARTLPPRGVVNSSNVKLSSKRWSEGEVESFPAFYSAHFIASTRYCGPLIKP